MTELEYVYLDPTFGEISCDNEAHAREASVINGVQCEVRVNFWKDGEVTHSKTLVIGEAIN